MQQDSRALVILLCLNAFAGVFILYTSQYLPDRVATHFGVEGRADGWMSRNDYLSFMLGLMVGMSALVGFIVGTLPRKFPQWTNIPNRDYWLALERRAESALFLSAHGKRLASLIVMMMLGMHYTILLANHMKPPALPGTTFTAILFGFALALLWWIVRL